MALATGEATAATVRAALARGLRELREAQGWRQDDVAQAARLAGLRWTASTVANVETERRDVSVAELLALGVALNLPVLRLLSLPEDGGTRHGAAWSPNDVVRWLLSGGEAGRNQDGRMREPDGRLSSGETAGWPDATVKAARRLGLEPHALEVLALDTFGRPFDNEREMRLAADPSWTPRTRQAMRGHVTRQLLSELTAAMPKPPAPAAPTRRKGRKA